ncbi:MAG: hypothetical protein CM15mP127_09530 [Gammaproteobacteria bacterium]|nr:MAG: hypothetical protein CM15mP127_09530 [Gammaproteobacteria bacterium]
MDRLRQNAEMFIRNTFLDRYYLKSITSHKASFIPIIFGFSDNFPTVDGPYHMLFLKVHCRDL